MKNFLVAGAVALGMTALTTIPAAAHPEDSIKPANQCDPITPAQWRQIRKGMTLDAVEHIAGCRASHSSTNEFKSFTVENFSFKDGSRKMADIKIRGGKLWQKYGYHSGL